MPALDWRVQLVDASGNAITSLSSDTELPAAAALADATANPTTPLIGANLEGFNGTTWDRLRTYLGAQGNAVATTPILAVASMMNDNSTNWVVQRTASAVLDGVAGGTIAPAAGWLWNGATFDRARTTPGVTGTTGTGLPAAGPCLWDLVGATNFVKQAGDGSGRAMVVGAAAAGSALVGNPLLLGVSDGTNAQYLRAMPSASSAAVSTAFGYAGVALWTSAGNAAPLVAANALTDGSGLLGGPPVGTFGYNGSNWDRIRNNVDATLLASAARTTTQGPTNITTYNARAIYIVLDMTNVAAAPSVTLKVEMIDPASGKAVVLLTGSAVTTVSTNIYKIGVGLTAAANLVANEYLPRTIAITVTANNANSGTYSVGYSLIAA